LPRLFGAYIGVVGEDWPSPQRGAFVQLAACIIQDKTRQGWVKVRKKMLNGLSDAFKLITVRRRSGTGRQHPHAGVKRHCPHAGV
jgi:hypothetical protein